MMLLAIPDGVIALGLGTALALGASAVVLGPLLRGDDVGDAHDTSRASRLAEPANAPSEGATAVDALREIEFDRATGKLSDTDYTELKATYTREALAELRAKDAGVAVPASAVGDDDVERVIQRFRAAGRGPVCPVDGPRPEADATFCSACGRYLAGRCPACDAPCADPEQRFCATCGTSLAARVAASAPAA